MPYVTDSESTTNIDVYSRAVRNGYKRQKPDEGEGFNTNEPHCVPKYHVL